MSKAQPGLSDSQQVVVRAVGHVHIENGIRWQRIRLQARDEVNSDLRCCVKVLAVLARERYGDGRKAEKTPFHSRRNGPGVNYVIPEIGAMIDAGYDNIRINVEESGQRQMYAIRWRTINEIPVCLYLMNPQRRMQCQRIAGAGVIPVRRNDDDIGNLR